MATGENLAAGLKALTARTVEAAVTRSMVDVSVGAVDVCRWGKGYEEAEE